MNNFGEYLKIHRIKNKKTQEDQGKDFGVSSNTIHRWEKGVTCPGISKRQTIADIMDVPLHSLFPDKNAEKMKKRKYAKKLSDDVTNESMPIHDVNEDNDITSLGCKIIKLRQRENETIKMQSIRIGVSVSTIVNWAKNKTVPKNANLKRIADVYGVSVGWLACSDGNEAISKIVSPQIDAKYSKLNAIFNDKMDIDILAVESSNRVGEQLKYLRNKNKMTMKELADALGFSLNTIYRWEHNLTKPRNTAIQKITDYFGIPEKWIWGETDFDNFDQRLLSILDKLPDEDKYKVLGYAEGLYIEIIDS